MGPFKEANKRGFLSCFNLSIQDMGGEGGEWRFPGNRWARCSKTVPRSYDLRGEFHRPDPPTASEAPLVT